MRVTVNFAGDVKVPGGTLAVHKGQAYDLPDDMAKAFVKGGSAYKGDPKPPKAEAPAPTKVPGVTPDEDGQKEGEAAAENKEAKAAPENKGAGKS